MADRVRFVMDRMSSTFAKLTDMKIFAEVEVKSIARRRTDFEYTMMRRMLYEADYYSYIDYEISLYKLLQLRIAPLIVGRTKDKDLQSNLRNVRAAFAHHVVYIFERATRRFPGSLNLWQDYISFLKDANEAKRLGTVLGKAIALYPKKYEFWALASSHELESNQNVPAARSLLQSALRVNQRSRELWMKYFELELWYGARTTTRQQTLGISDSSDDSVGGGETLVSNNYLVPLVVFRHAVKAIPSIEFACELHSCCRPVSAKLASVIENEMISMNNFSQSGALWHYILLSNIENSLQPARRRNGKFRALSIQSTLEFASTALRNAISILKTAVRFVDISSKESGALDFYRDIVSSTADMLYEVSLFIGNSCSVVQNAHRNSDEGDVEEVDYKKIAVLDILVQQVVTFVLELVPSTSCQQDKMTGLIIHTLYLVSKLRRALSVIHRPDTNFFIMSAETIAEWLKFHLNDEDWIIVLQDLFDVYTHEAKSSPKRSLVAENIFMCVLNGVSKFTSSDNKVIELLFLKVVDLLVYLERTRDGLALLLSAAKCPLCVAESRGVWWARYLFLSVEFYGLSVIESVQKEVFL